MKFTVNTKELIQAIQAVLPAVDKTAGLDRIYIKAENYSLSITAWHYNHYFTKHIDDIETESGGTIAFTLDNIKAVLKAKTTHITIETDGKYILIHTGSRTIKAAATEIDETLLCPPGDEFTDVMTLTEKDFTETINNLKLFTKKDTLRASLANLNVNSVDMCMEAVNGSCALRRRFTMENFKEDISFMIPADVIEHLKKTLDKTSENNITLSISKERGEKHKGYICIKGNTFEYYHINAEGQFFSTSNIFNSISDKNIYSLSAKELQEIISYYNDVKDKSDKLEILMSIPADNKIYLYYVCSQMEIFDSIQAEPEYDRWNTERKVALDGKFILDFLKIPASLRQDKIKFYMSHMKSNIFFSTENYECCICPINVQNETLWQNLESRIPRP